MVALTTLDPIVVALTRLEYRRLKWERA